MKKINEKKEGLPYWVISLEKLIKEAENSPVIKVKQVGGGR